ncbi:MAG: aminotransferase class III-fold pyridoxal phosphate-dependent enzyme, partial [Eubacteriales bacterium]
MKYEKIKQTENEHFVSVFGRLDACFTKGKGMTLIEKRGRQYTDFLSGIAVNALGYSDEGFKRTIKKQTDKLLHTSNYFYIEPQSELLEALYNATGYERAFIA